MRYFRQKSNNSLKIRLHKNDFSVSYYQENLQEVLEQANDCDYSSKTWYYKEHQNILDVWHNLPYKLPFDDFVKIIALISPSVPWENNIAYAKAIVRTRQNPGTYANFFQTSIAILDGIEYNFSARALKTYAFYHNLLNPEESYHVTIDRHMILASLGGDNIALGCAVSMPKCEYQKIEEAVRNIACKMECKPHSVQAIIWSTKKRLQKECPLEQKQMIMDKYFNR